MLTRIQNNILTAVNSRLSIQLAGFRAPTRHHVVMNDTLHRYVSVDISKSLQDPHKQHSQKRGRNRRQARGKQRRDSGRAAYRFVDRTRVQVSGGSGGKGSTSTHHITRKRKKRPDGGHGGNGGSIIVVADPKEQSLRWTHPHVVAEAGKHGTSQERHGRRGRNTVLRVPCGVVIRRILDFDEEWNEETKTVRKVFQQDSTIDYDEDEDEDEDNDWSDDEYLEASTEESFEQHSDIDFDEEFLPTSSTGSSKSKFMAWGEREKVVVSQLDEPGSHVVVARGGRGGTGSCAFASYNGPVSPEKMAQHATPQPGEIAYLELELKMISDLGLVGFPNAGKSSLLAAMSRATPHIAPYPFTTLNPLVGYIEYRDGFRVCAADIPGLIAGASEGRGRGHDFLRHLERTSALLYIVDAAGVDGRDPVQDLKTLIDELSAYGDGSMLDREALVVANKVDLLSPTRVDRIVEDLEDVVQEYGIRTNGKVLSISAGVTGEGLSPLSKTIREVIQKAQTVEAA